MDTMLRWRKGVESARARQKWSFAEAGTVMARGGSDSEYRPKRMEGWQKRERIVLYWAVVVGDAVECGRGREGWQVVVVVVV